jgi:hypothetical protein
MHLFGFGIADRFPVQSFDALGKFLPPEMFFLKKTIAYRIIISAIKLNLERRL